MLPAVLADEALADLAGRGYLRRIPLSWLRSQAEAEAALRASETPVEEPAPVAWVPPLPKPPEYLWQLALHIGEKDPVRIDYGTVEEVADLVKWITTTDSTWLIYNNGAVRIRAIKQASYYRRRNPLALQDRPPSTLY